MTTNQNTFKSDLSQTIDLSFNRLQLYKKLANIEHLNI